MAEKRTRGELRNSKLQKVAANLFLKHGYDAVSVDRIVEMAGGSKSTVYSEFGGKCGLFIRSIETMCLEASEPLAQLEYAGLNLEQSLKKLAFHILKLITSPRSVELHRLAVAEAAQCPEVGEAWYEHGPKKTTAYLQDILQRHRAEFPKATIPIEQIAVMLHDALTGDALSRRLAGVSKAESDVELRRKAKAIVDIALAALRADSLSGD